jgi:CheY-like chemotaxis protein
MPKLLYVEDDAASRRVMQMTGRMLAETLEIVIFEDSADFSARLLNVQPPPDLILLDIHVTPYTGFEMYAMIRQMHQFDGTPVVALTASVMNEEVQLLHDAGFHGVLSKPLNIDVFSEVVDRFLSGEKIWYVW